MERDVPPTKPTLFIGSSSQGLPVARKLVRCLSRAAKCNIWTMQGIFGLGEMTLEALLRATRKHDFAVLVLTPDSFLNQEGEEFFLPRGNVIFELGLFMGTIGKERTFIVHDDRIRLPSDLDGVTRASFSGLDLKEACAKLKGAMVSAPQNLPNLTGKWFSTYQRHDDPLGEWVEDMVDVTAKPPGKLSFRNYQDPVGSNYEAVGEFRGKNEIVGIWYETLETAHGSGTSHLFKDPYAPKLYGVCTGPTTRGQYVYSGWILVRDHPEKLTSAKRDLIEAMLVCDFHRAD